MSSAKLRGFTKIFFIFLFLTSVGIMTATSRTTSQPEQDHYYLAFDAGSTGDRAYLLQLQCGFDDAETGFAENALGSITNLRLLETFSAPTQRTLAASSVAELAQEFYVILAKVDQWLVEHSDALGLGESSRVNVLLYATAGMRIVEQVTQETKYNVLSDVIRTYRRVSPLLKDLTSFAPHRGGREFFIMHYRTLAGYEESFYEWLGLLVGTNSKIASLPSLFRHTPLPITSPSKEPLSTITSHPSSSATLNEDAAAVRNWPQRRVESLLLGTDSFDFATFTVGGSSTQLQFELPEAFLTSPEGQAARIALNSADVEFLLSELKADDTMTSEPPAAAATPKSTTSASVPEVYQLITDAFMRHHDAAHLIFLDQPVTPAVAVSGVFSSLLGTGWAHAMFLSLVYFLREIYFSDPAARFPCWPSAYSYSYTAPSRLATLDDGSTHFAGARFENRATGTHVFAVNGKPVTPRTGIWLAFAERAERTEANHVWYRLGALRRSRDLPESFEVLAQWNSQKCFDLVEKSFLEALSFPLPYDQKADKSDANFLTQLEIVSQIKRIWTDVTAQGHFDSGRNVLLKEYACKWFPPTDPTSDLCETIPPNEVPPLLRDFLANTPFRRKTSWPDVSRNLDTRADATDEFQAIGQHTLVAHAVLHQLLGLSNHNVSTAFSLNDESPEWTFAAAFHDLAMGEYCATSSPAATRTHDGNLDPVASQETGDSREAASVVGDQEDEVEERIVEKNYQNNKKKQRTKQENQKKNQTEQKRKRGESISSGSDVVVVADSAASTSTPPTPAPPDDDEAAEAAAASLR